MVWKFGEEVAAQVLSPSSDRGSNLPGISQNSAHVASKWNVSVANLSLPPLDTFQGYRLLKRRNKKTCYTHIDFSFPKNTSQLLQRSVDLGFPRFQIRSLPNLSKLPNCSGTSGI
ncbi:hypothetical protein AVEN_164235-1 [Araneus ventricosus]|uniref:Uncharacterized protein n=1 Tax=Araneus ventricosus TaxID=182803 RepID=A0A4Y2IFW8_ARAVE|nr:hypothetical protein AVEN_164235-1 [Araneus ventricosus]